MDVRAGATLGPYRVVEQIGAGGMGEVWRAQDTRLDRSVAIKILPEEYASDPERLARFRQEARAAAALSHPHIAAVHDVGQRDDTHFIVQEFLRGQSLRELLARGRLKLERAAEILAAVADALAAAHRVGIVHRDIKPDNIFITESGHTKVVDFGLAKVNPSPAKGELRDPSMSPTAIGTMTGVVMGTVAYMAPEQVEGGDVDGRTDLFAFGCVLYEAIGGRRPFRGKNVHSTLDQILSATPPPLRTLRPELPQRIEWIVERCLAKDPAKRFQHAEEVAIELRQLSAELSAGSAPDSSPLPVAPPGGRGRRALALGAVLILMLAAALVWIRPEPGPPDNTGSAGGAVAVTLEPELPLNIEFSFAVRLSPDGSSILYRSGNEGWAGGRLYHRRLDEHRAVPLPATEGGLYPAISTTGERFAFFAPDGPGGIAEWRYRLMTATIDAASPTPIAVTGMPFGATWLDESRLVYGDLARSGLPGPERTQTAGLHLATLGGEPPRQLTEPTVAGETHLWPAALPGGAAVLFTIAPPEARYPRDGRIAMLDLESGEVHDLLDNGSHPVYLSSGHLLFLRNQQLFAAPFDPGSGTVSGAERPVLDSVLSYDLFTTPGFDVSRRGHLVYLEGPPPDWQARLALYDVASEAHEWLELPTVRTIGSPSFSPDGRRLAFGVWPTDSEHATLQLLDLRSGIRTPTELPGNLGGIAWSPDGDRLAYGWTDEDQGWGLRSQRYDGAAPRDLLAVDERPGQLAAQWLEDGTLLFVRWGGATRWDVWSLSPSGEEGPVLTSPAPETCPSLSPDGRWLSYASRDEAGAWHVYVVSFPELEYRTRVSQAPGSSPRWSADGSGLYYATAEDSATNRIVRAAIDVEEGGVVVGATEPVVELPGRSPTLHLCRFAVGPEDDRIALPVEVPNRDLLVTELNLLWNWAPSPE